MPDRRLWKPRMRIEQSYASEMLDLIYREFLPAFLRRGGSLSLIDLDIDDFAEDVAKRMVAQVSTANAKSWRQAAQQSSHGLRIYRALRGEMQGSVGAEVRRLIRENAELIQSLPHDLALSASRYVAAEQRKGVRAATIAKELKKRLPQLAESRIHLIARTQVAASETAMTQVRAQNVGIRWYEWQTSRDQRVRRSHQKMNEVLVPWADPAAPEALVGERSTLGHYPPGGCPNCRCVALPLVRLDEVTWPHRVYVGGKISWLSRAAFARIAGLPEVRRAA